MSKIYLISPSKINKNDFLPRLSRVLRTSLVPIFQLRIKEYPYSEIKIIAKEVKKRDPIILNSKSGKTKISLRSPQGQFTSVTKLETLIRASLQRTIIKNMQRPNLRNQTGRFASSVKLESVSQARDGALTAFLSYMRYPYATFENGGKQGKKGYYPSRLIDQSVREIAKTLVTQRMKVTVQ